MISALSKAGLENFSQYGKLVGTGKNNGIKVYEKLTNGERILTGVKDGTVRKIVTKHGRTVNAEDKINDTYTTVSKGFDTFNLHRENNKDGVSEFLERKKSGGEISGTYSKYAKQGEADILDLRVAQEPHSLGKIITIKSNTGIELGGQSIPKFDEHRFLKREYDGTNIFSKDHNCKTQSLDTNLAEAIWNAFSKLLS